MGPALVAQVDYNEPRMAQKTSMLFQRDENIAPCACMKTKSSACRRSIVLWPETACGLAFVVSTHLMPHTMCRQTSGFCYTGWYILDTSDHTCGKAQNRRACRSSLMAAMCAAVNACSLVTISAAAPRPTMPSTFSVPARLPPSYADAKPHKIKMCRVKFTQAGFSASVLAYCRM